MRGELHALLAQANPVQSSLRRPIRSSPESGCGTEGAGVQQGSRGCRHTSPAATVPDRALLRCCALPVQEQAETAAKGLEGRARELATSLEEAQRELEVATASEGEA